MLSKTMLARSGLIALLAAAPAMPPATARADQQGGSKPAVSESDRAVARRHFERGKELHAAGKYQEAATEYMAAYDRFPAPAFLYNVAQVYRLAGDKRLALENYRKYIEQEPNGEGSADAREFIAALEAALEAERAAAASQEPPPQQPVEEIRERPDPIDPIASTVPPAQVDIDANAGRTKKIAGIVVGAAGAVGLGVGFVFALQARSATDELNSYEGPWTEEQQGVYDDGKSAERTALISGAIGGGALVTGAILYYLGSRDARRATERRHRNADMVSDLPAPRRIQLGAAPTADGALFLVRGAF